MRLITNCPFPVRVVIDAGDLLTENAIAALINDLPTLVDYLSRDAEFITALLASPRNFDPAPVLNHLREVRRHITCARLRLDRAALSRVDDSGVFSVRMA